MKKLLPVSMVLFAMIMSCSKKSETLSFADIKDYNLQIPGKQITYKLDSSLYIHFGTKDTVVSYFVKDSVMDEVTDNLGRKAFRIVRYSRRSTGAPWNPVNTFLTIPTSSRIEFIENNNRFVKLTDPLSEISSWKGNAYLDTYSAFSNIQYMDDWDYTYANIGQPLVLGSITLDNTITVNEHDQEDGIFTDNLTDTTYSEKNLSIEKYAKGVGLVYRNFLHREYQPASAAGAAPHNGFKAGYGVTMTMINHN